MASSNHYYCLQFIPKYIGRTEIKDRPSCQSVGPTISFSLDMIGFYSKFIKLLDEH